MNKSATLATPAEAKVLSAQRRRMLPSETITIAEKNNLVDYHTYDLIRAADYLSAMSRRLWCEVRRRHEQGTI
jgi:hypothetical protein